MSIIPQTFKDGFKFTTNNTFVWPLFLPSVVIFIKGPVHTNAFSFENAYVSMRLCLSSTLIRCSFSSKTNRFENALENGSTRKRIHIVLVWTVENVST